VALAELSERRLGSGLATTGSHFSAA
jgi:hypothetical protein